MSRMTGAAIPGAIIASILLLAMPSAYGGHLSYVFSEEETRATHVLRFDVCLAPGALVEFHTEYTLDSDNGFPSPGLEPEPLYKWADPQMHILKVVDNNFVERFYDDDSHDGINPSITFQVGPGNECENYRILVRAFDNASGGSGGATFKLYLGHSLLGTFRLGGYQIDPAFAVGPERTLETVRVNNGAAAAVIYRFEKAADGHFAYADVNHGSGVGLDSAKVVGTQVSSNPASVQWVIATPYTETREGPIRVLENDIGDENDSDGDGLSDALEYYLQTCPSRTLTQFRDCTNINPRDTDGDGIEDGLEARGLDDEFFPQKLPLWGADPLHRDVFVVIDIHETAQNRFPPEESFIFAAERWDALDNLNPDGDTGVRLHFDVSRPCRSEVDDVDGITAICGMFGGSSVVASVTDSAGNPTNTGLEEGTKNLATVRHGIFHWGMGTLNGGGNGDTPGYRFVFQATAGPDGVGAILAHELGHNAGGIQHYGDPGNPKLNGAPNYPSIMNYAYQNSMRGSIQNVAFSRGESESVNPADLSETTDFSPGVDVSYLNAAPHNFDSRPGFPNQIDWNRDGYFDSAVQANILSVPLRANFGGAQTPPLIGAQNVVGSRTEAGVGVAEFDAVYQAPSGPFLTKALWVVANNAATNEFEYRHLFTGLSSLSDEWSSLDGVVFRPDSEPEAVVYDAEIAAVVAKTGLLESGGKAQARRQFPNVLATTTHVTPREPRLFVFGMEDSSGDVRYASLASDHEGAPDWHRITVPAGLEFTSVSAAVIDQTLYLIARNDSTVGEDEVWMNSTPSGSSWRGWSKVSDAAGPVQSLNVTPGLAAGPDGRLYMFIKSGDINYRFEQIAMFAYDPVNQSWARQNVPWQDGGLCRIVGTPGAVFAEHTNAVGASLPRGNGAFYLWYTVAGPDCDGLNNFYRISQGGLDADGLASDFKMGPWLYTPLTKPNAVPFCHTEELPDGGFAVVKTSDFKVRAFASHVGSTQCPDQVIYLPNADGIVSLDVPDTNDHAFIEAGTCTSIHKDNPCECLGTESCSARVITYPSEDCLALPAIE